MPRREAARRVLVASEASLGACLVLLGVWVFVHLGGVGREGALLFNWHPLLMALAFLGAMTQGLLAFSAGGRTPQAAGYDRAQRKWLHWVINGSATCLALAGFYAAFRFHAQQGIPHVYSVHATLGVAVLALLCLQFALGFAAFLASTLGLPDLFSSSTKRALVPVHAFLGLGAYGGGLAALLTGLMDKQALINFVQQGDKFAAASALPNWIAVLAALGVLGVVAHVASLSGGGGGTSASGTTTPSSAAHGRDGDEHDVDEADGDPSDLERILLVPS